MRKCFYNWNFNELIMEYNLWNHTIFKLASLFHVVITAPFLQIENPKSKLEFQLLMKEDSFMKLHCTVSTTWTSGEGKTVETVSSRSARGGQIRRKGEPEHRGFHSREASLYHLINIHLSKYTEFSTPRKINARVNPNVKYELRVIMRCQCILISLMVANVAPLLRCWWLRNWNFYVEGVVNFYAFYLLLL